MVNKGDNIIDTRIVLAQWCELQDELKGLEEALNEAKEELESLQDDEGFTEDDLEEAKEATIYIAQEDLDSFINDENYTDTKELMSEIELLYGYKDGLTLIEEDYFEDYARELAKDIGAITDDKYWPCDCIDWEKAANALKNDYTSLNWGDCLYWVRQI